MNITNTTEEIGGTNHSSANYTGGVAASGDWSALVGYLVVLSFLGCYLACVYTHHCTTARIVKANRVVTARILTHKARRGGGAHDNDVEASMLLSYVYENKNHQVWKNNYGGFESLSCCRVYVDPSEPRACVVQGQRWSESGLGLGSVIRVCFFFAVNTAAYLGLTNLMLVTKASRIIAWVLYGSVWFMPAISIMCFKCCKSLCRQERYDVLDAKETGDIEMEKQPSAKSTQPSFILREWQ